MFNFKNKRIKKNLENEQKLGSALITYFEPMSAIAEQYRTLRTNIEFAQISKNMKSLAITSSIPMEGKSTTAVNLAYTYAQTNRKVLIVDADLRKPTLHRTFKLNNTRGLTTLLINEEKPSLDIIQRSEELGLYFLTSGPIPPNPAELLASTQMKSLVEELTEIFDLVIFDTPPIQSVTDPQIISSIVDGVILVARQNYVRKDQVNDSKESLEKVKANILGFVLNDASIEKNRGYGYYEYYGANNHE